MKLNNGFETRSPNQAWGLFMPTMINGWPVASVSWTPLVVIVSCAWRMNAVRTATILRNSLFMCSIYFRYSSLYLQIYYNSSISFHSDRSWISPCAYLSYLFMKYMRAIWANRIRGSPYLNFKCIVLWCQTCMPNNAPMLPPMTASNSKVASEMRQLPCLAFHLSMP